MEKSIVNKKYIHYDRNKEGVERVRGTFVILTVVSRSSTTENVYIRMREKTQRWNRNYSKGDPVAGTAFACELLLRGVLFQMADCLFDRSDKIVRRIIEDGDAFLGKFLRIFF